MPRSTLLLLIALPLLAGCATARSEPSVSCPTSKQYSRDQLGRAADELEALPAGSVIGGMIVDYGQLRRKIAACSGQ